MKLEVVQIQSKKFSKDYTDLSIYKVSSQQLLFMLQSPPWVSKLVFMTERCCSRHQTPATQPKATSERCFQQRGRVFSQRRRGVTRRQLGQTAYKYCKRTFQRRQAAAAGTTDRECRSWKVSSLGGQLKKKKTWGGGGGQKKT